MKYRKIFFVGAILFSNYTISSSSNFRAEAVSFVKQMKNNWGTICLPFDIAVNSDDEYTLYSLKNIIDDTMMFEAYRPNSVIPAGTPCVLWSSKTGMITIHANNCNICLDAATISSGNKWTMRGTFPKQSITTEGVYYISNNAFWLKTPNTPLTVPPFCAWFDNLNIAEAKSRLSISVVEKDFLGIDSFMNDDSVEYYNVNGIKMQTLQPGINIVKHNNGIVKKILIK